MKLKDSKDCQCFERDYHLTSVTKECRFGYCTMVLCTKCGLSWAEFGPIDCPHKKNENGTLRWYKYPDMDTKKHVPVKKNARR